MPRLLFEVALNNISREIQRQFWITGRTRFTLSKRRLGVQVVTIGNRIAVSSASARGRGGLLDVRTVFLLEQELESELDLSRSRGSAADSAKAPGGLSVSSSPRTGENPSTRVGEIGMI